MRIFTTNAYFKARAFIDNHARQIDRRRFEYLFSGGSREGVGAALTRYQNDDGGLGRALEPDFRLPASSALATVTGLEIAHEARLPADHPVVQKAIGYLVSTYDASRPGWAAVPEQVNDYPHAPWWHVDSQTGKSLPETPANPAAKAAAFLLAWPDLAPVDFTQTVLRGVLEYIQTAPALEMESLRTLRLLASEMEPGPDREAVVAALRRGVSLLVDNEPARWAEYGPQPLFFAPSPKSLLAADLAPGLELNLDYRIDTQKADGSWWPNWSWGDSYHDVWPAARLEWQGVLTVEAVKALNEFGRLEHRPG